MTLNIEGSGISFRRAGEPKKRPPPPPINFSVCDIEAMNWIDFLCIGYYDGSEYAWFDNLQEFFEYIFLDEKREFIYAHFGGGYDFLFLLDFLDQTDIYTVSKIINRGSIILQFDVEFDGIKKTFRDSIGLLPFKLETLAKSFNVSLKSDYDHSKTRGITKKLLSYMMDDHIALYEVLKKYQQNPLIEKTGLRMTRSGQTYEIFRTQYLDQKIIPLKDNVDEFCRKAYLGGRAEIFRPYFKASKRKLRCYDVNSLYPFVMRDNEYPVAFDHFTSQIEVGKLGIYNARVRVPKMFIPPLGVKYKGKLIFPVGEFSGFWTGDELLNAEKYGVEILEVYNGVVFKNGGKIFQQYMTDMYAKRMEAKEAKDGAGDTIYKDAMNHLFGRFALRKDREEFCVDDGSENFRPIFSRKCPDGTKRRYGVRPKRINAHTFSPIAIFVTSYARIYNYNNFLFPYRENIYYTDTDSFFLDCKLETGSKLGELKFEYEREEACFVLPKTYATKDKNGEVFAKMKGFDAKKVMITDPKTGKKKCRFSMEDFKESLSGEIRNLKINTDARPARIKEALSRHGKILAMNPESTKKIMSQYDKRKIIKVRNKWTTAPLTIDF